MSEKQTNSPKDLWMDGSGHLVKVDEGKWNQHDKDAKLAAGWRPATDDDVAAAELAEAQRQGKA